MSDVLNETRRLNSISIEGGEKSFSGYIIRDVNTSRFCGYVFDNAKATGEAEDARLVVGRFVQTIEGYGVKLYIAIAAPPNDDVDFFKRVLSVRDCLGNMYGFCTSCCDGELGFLGEWEVHDTHIIPNAELVSRTMAGIKISEVKEDDSTKKRVMSSFVVEIAHRYSAAGGVYINFFRDLLEKSDYSLIENLI